jgi:hypothetical protein
MRSSHSRRLNGKDDARNEGDCSRNDRVGPVDERVTFDQYAIFEGDQPMIVIPEESTVCLPRGFLWDWQLSVDVLSERLTHYEHK